MATPLIPSGPLALSAEHAVHNLRDIMQGWPRDAECDRSLVLPLVPIEPLPVVEVSRVLRIPDQREAPVGRHRAPA